MSLKKYLKTYLIVAVMLVMGGMAVKTVAIADPDDSYSLTIEKKVTGIPDGEKNTYKDVEYTFKYEISDGKSGTIKLKDGETKKIEDVKGPCTVTIEEIIDENIKRLENYELKTNEIKYESAADDTSGKVKLSVEGKVEGTSAASNGIYVGENGKITIALKESQVENKSYLYRILNAEGSTIENENGEGGLSKDNAQISVEGLGAGNYFIEMAEKSEASVLPDSVNDVPIEEDIIILPKEQNEIKEIETEETGNKEPEEKENPEENIKQEEFETQTNSNKDNTPEISGEEILDEDVARASIGDVQEDVPESDSAGDSDGDDTSKNDPEGNAAEDDTSKNDPEGTDKDEDNITENDEDNPVESNDNENAPDIDEPEIGADNGIMFASSEEDPEYTYSGFNVSYSYNETGNVFENIVYSENVKITVDTTELTAGNYQVNIKGANIENSISFEKTEDFGSKSFAEFAGYTNESPLPAGTYQMEVTGGGEATVSSTGNKVEVTLGDGNAKRVKLICTNPYKPKGAYNIVHEYYVDKITSRDAKECEGISSITIEEGDLGTNVTGEEVPKVLKFGNYTYEYVEDKNAYGYGKEDITVSGNDAGIALLADEGGSDNGSDSAGWEPVKDYQEEAGKTSAIVQEAGNEVVILKYVRTTDPGKPDKPDEPDLPDPNDPDSPPTVTIPDGDVPRTYVRVWDPQKEEWVYLPEDEVPLAGRTSAKTADSMAPVFWMFMTGMSVAGVGIFHYNKKKKEE